LRLLSLALGSRYDMSPTLVRLLGALSIVLVTMGALLDNFHRLPEYRALGRGIFALGASLLGALILYVLVLADI